MIFETKGDLLATEYGIIAHQVNCRGVMGAGVARQIRKKLLTSEQYWHYQNLCRKHGSTLLGKCFFYPVNSQPGLYVANLFGENIPTGRGLDTCYEALENSLRDLDQRVGPLNLPIYIPGYLGCGLAGGDWDRVYREILIPLFGTCEQTELHIVYSMESVRKLWTEFGNVPMDPETEKTEHAWHCFPAGTWREDIWEWFEKTFDLSVAENLMFSKGKE